MGSLGSPDTRHGKNAAPDAGVVLDAGGFAAGNQPAHVVADANGSFAYV